MANLNKVMLIGNLTRDPEVRYTPKGTAVTDIGLAVNRNYTTDTGEKREDTTFVDITLWGRQAEVVGQYMKKGRPIYIEGRLQMDTWVDKTTNQNRSKLKVIGESFQFLGGRDDAGGGGGGGGYQQSQAPAQGYNQEPQQQHQPQVQAPADPGPSQSAPPQQQSAPPPAGDSAPPAEEEDDIPF